MVYSNRFVACVLVNGLPQKELANGTVTVPFGTEYSLRFRNKNNRRAVVKFTIDGENVSGNGYVLPANGHLDIHRHHDKDARFKFVSLDSAEAVDFGKNGPNTDGSKGVIEAKFYLEKATAVPAFTEVHHHHHHYPRPRPPFQPYPYHPQWGYKQPLLHRQVRSRVTTKGMECNAGGSCEMGATFGTNMPEVIPPTVHITDKDLSFVAPLREGCTVEGGASGQSFRTVSFDAESDFVVVRLILKGGEPVVEAQTTATINTDVFPEGALPVYCTNCGGKKARSSDRFCGLCGHKF